MPVHSGAAHRPFSALTTAAPLLPQGEEAGWPQWMEALRVDDTCLAAAYDGSSPQQRSCLKNGIAFQALKGESPHRQERTLYDRDKGFGLHEIRSPAPWAVLFCTPAYAAAPRLTAALMPALLARIPLVGAICLGGDFHPNILLALELLGMEDIFCADMAAGAHLLEEMANTTRGRVLLLHQGTLHPLREKARQHHLPLWEENSPPRLCSVAQAAPLVHWGHPDAQVHPLPDPSLALASMAHAAPPRWDVAFLEQGMPDLPQASQIYFPGLEGCWRHADLHSHFFQICHVTATPLAAWEGDEA